MPEFLYHSTRNKQITVTAAQAVMAGIAPDGGLYTLPGFGGLPFDAAAALTLPPAPRAAKILSALLPSFTEEELSVWIDTAYATSFPGGVISPLRRVGDDFVLELFHGPTCAFKDVALCLLPHLMTAAARKCGCDDRLLILTATSGDTGTAAMAGFCDVAGTSIIVFYPDGGVSPVQRAQMVTQKGKNVRVCAVKGNFDDAQTGVKGIFAGMTAPLLQRGVRLSSANSINIGRLAPQVVYYFNAYADLIKMGRIAPGDPVDFCVPTGNFGNILAGYIARDMGLPVGRLICASNTNNVLTDFFRTGCYDRRRPFHRTTSPSMDILISSNLERLLYLASRDCDLVAHLMDDLTRNGFYQVPDALLSTLQGTFWAADCDEEAAAAAIRRVWQEQHYLIDPHTAVAFHAAQGYRRAEGSTAPMVILSTASPFKFPEAVLQALGERNAFDEPLDGLTRLSEITDLPIPDRLLCALRDPVLHRDCVEIPAMPAFVSAYGEAIR